MMYSTTAIRARPITSKRTKATMKRLAEAPRELEAVLYARVSSEEQEKEADTARHAVRGDAKTGLIGTGRIL